MVQTIGMPGVLANESSHDPRSIHSRSLLSNGAGNAITSRQSSELLRRESSERPTPAVDGLPGGWPHTPMGISNGGVREGIGGRDGSILSVPDGTSASDRAPSAKSVALSTRTRRSSGLENDKKSGEVVKEEVPRPGAAEEGYFTSVSNGKPVDPARSPSARRAPVPNDDATPFAPHTALSANVPVAPTSALPLPPVQEGFPAQNPRFRTIPSSADGPEAAISATSYSSPSVPNTALSANPPMAPTSALPLPPVQEGFPAQNPQQTAAGAMLKPPNHHQHRASSPPAFLPASSLALSNGTLLPQSRQDKLAHRHTLEVPRISTFPSSADGPDAAISASGYLSPTRQRRRSRLSHPDMQPDQMPQDEDAARWAEVVKAKLAAKRHRSDTDDDRVVVGTKIDETHNNFVRAYNMLTGIRFCVSRIHAKMDRELTDADFLQAQKYSFDVTGSELTPSAKYDFKFKDYAPWVFRHIRSSFSIDPAEYLVSLTAKYILSELGSPGKSGSFFYFSRDYKYIIKTIHHAEHKFLRKILKDYYNHIRENPDTLLSQFYGLHRVKLPYGKKVHFVIMNNLFPPHRDIHRTFDLKGSTIGRDFREEDLEKNPRATLKDLNWLRRNLHLEFGPTKKEAFVAQMQRDVALLQRLKIMDYSLLVGIHDLERGNEENLRDKTLQVFQPGGSTTEEPQMGALTRTPSKMESAKRARELRESIKKERPIPMGQTVDKMPDEAHRKGFYFYADDGGFQATHEDDVQGEEIYYLGIIDCLTRYNVVKKAEHFWKGMGGHESQISPIPPERYGDRFIRFISGITKSRERAEKERLSATFDDPNLGGVNIQHDDFDPAGTDVVMEQAMREADRSRRHGANESDIPDRSISAVRDAGADGSTLPVIGEAAENASNNSRTPSGVTPSRSREDVAARQPVLGDANMPADSIGDVPPPTPPKLDGTPDVDERSFKRESWGGGPPPTPPKDDRRGRFPEKDLPLPPVATKVFSASPSRMVEEEMRNARAKVNGGL